MLCVLMAFAVWIGGCLLLTGPFGLDTRSVLAGGVLFFVTRLACAFGQGLTNGAHKELGRSR